MTELPIACTLTPDALRARQAGLLSDLLRRTDGREDLSGGIRLRSAPTGETLLTIVRAVEAERHCCRFLRFGITIEPDGGACLPGTHWASRNPGVHGRTARSVTTNLAIFALAALFEIAGCFAFWGWLRRGASPVIAVLGVVSLVGFAVSLCHSRPRTSGF